MFSKLLSLAQVIKVAALSEDSERLLRAVSEYAAEGADLVKKLREGPFAVESAGTDDLAACCEVLDFAPPVKADENEAVGIGPMEIIAIIQAAQQIAQLLRNLREKRKAA